MRRQLKKLAVVVGMVTLMTGATSVMGDLTESNSSYYNFSVSAHGGSQSTGVVKKTTSKSTAARFTTVTYSNASSATYPLYVRVRAKNGDFATNCRSVWALSSGEINLNYLDGMSKKGNYYYLKMQTDDLSTSTGKMRGLWRP